VPFVLSVSALLPASIQTPTVEVCAHGECSVAIYSLVSSSSSIHEAFNRTVRPLESVVDSVLEGSTGLAYLRRGLRMALRACRLRRERCKLSASR
jgi:hypothetical protein